MTTTKLIELSYGCTCCTLREDLVETIGAPALERRSRSCRIGES
nr:GTP-binding protein [Rhodococcus fascians]